MRGGLSHCTFVANWCVLLAGAFVRSWDCVFVFTYLVVTTEIISFFGLRRRTQAMSSPNCRSQPSVFGLWTRCRPPHIRYLSLIHI